MPGRIVCTLDPRFTVTDRFLFLIGHASNRSRLLGSFGKTDLLFTKPNNNHDRPRLKYKQINKHEGRLYQTPRVEIFLE